VQLRLQVQLPTHVHPVKSLWEAICAVLVRAPICVEALQNVMRALVVQVEAAAVAVEEVPAPRKCVVVGYMNATDGAIQNVHRVHNPVVQQPIAFASLRAVRKACSVDFQGSV